MEKPLKLKVCGMRDPQNIMEVAALSPDFMGFIFYRDSPRYVGESFCVPPGFPPAIMKTGVFVNSKADEVRKLREKHKLDLLQLHGNESVEFCRELKRDPVRIVKVFSMDKSFNFDETRKFEGVADYFMFDTRGKYFGGNATSFDWSLLMNYDQSVPFFLSGGISPENARDILSLSGLNLMAVDVNSGVERSPGVKDVDLVAEIKKILENK